MSLSTQLLRAILLLPLLLTGQINFAKAGTGPVISAGSEAAVPSLAAALAPDGTLRPGASGSFDAQQFAMSSAPDGRPVFRPKGTLGAGDQRWQNGFNLPNGTDGTVKAVVAAGTNVYIGGLFTQVGGVLAQNVAKWDGTTWSSLATGLTNSTSDYVNALAVASNGDLYVAGGFTTIGGMAANRIAKWNGTAWSALGTGFNGNLLALAVAGNGDVYAGGSFSQAGGVAANNLARWNGTTWSPVAGAGASNGTNGSVYALAMVANGDLYVGGSFSQAGGINVGGVAKWDGTAWSDMFSGVGGGSFPIVYALAVSRTGSLYVAGNFTVAGRTSASCIAEWDGTNWNALGDGTNTTIRALALASNGTLYAGGNFDQASGIPASCIAKWNGTSWSNLGSGFSNIAGASGLGVSALAVAGSGELYTGGSFTHTGSTLANNFAKWNGTSWSTPGSGNGNGVNGEVHAVAVATNGDVYVGGTFTAAGAAFANNVAKWNGSAWSSLGTGPANGVDAYVNAIAVTGNEVYVGGGFASAGGVPASYIAKWNGISWSSLGSGLNFPVYALATAPTGEVYVGGDFTQVNGQPISYLAKWNGSAWSAVGTSNGFNGRVAALAMAHNGDLYAAGGFGQAGGVAVSCIAKWNGTTWAGLGAGSSLYVPCIAVAPNGDVYASGIFAGGSTSNLNRRVAKWNGTTWTTLPVGPYSVETIALSGAGTLYVGGGDGISTWNGTRWGTPGTGTAPGFGRNVICLTAGRDSSVYVGGGFTTVGDGSKIMCHIGVFDAPSAGALSTASGAILKKTVGIYPNPARGAAFLTIPAANDARTIQLFDAAGRRVRQQVLPARATAATLDLTGLRAGTYVVRLGDASSQLVLE